MLHFCLPSPASFNRNLPQRDGRQVDEEEENMVGMEEGAERGHRDGQQQKKTKRKTGGGEKGKGEKIQSCCWENYLLLRSNIVSYGLIWSWVVKGKKAKS